MLKLSVGVFVALTATPAFAACVDFDREETAWVNNCGYDVLIDYEASGGDCAYSGGDTSTGATGRVSAYETGAYNPTLKYCHLEFHYCEYDEWVSGNCNSYY